MARGTRPPRTVPLSVRGYLRQSPFTSPGSRRTLFDPLPGGTEALLKVVQGLLIHYRDTRLASAHVPKRRFRDVDLRYVDRMLERVVELDPRPLSQPRPVDRRLIGCCRDFATLFTSMARHKGIPTRTRVGFANYFASASSRYWIDHTIAERWDGPRSGWRLVDPEQTPALARENHLDFDPTDVPSGKFITGGRAWTMCREEGVNPDIFCVEPGGQPRGLWFVRSRLVLDIAALNREELLLWDSWRATSPNARLTAVELEGLDRIARVTRRTPPPTSKVAALYRSGEWRHPSRVGCFSPVCPPYRELLRK